jgi:hypothetical protein
MFGGFFVCARGVGGRAMMHGDVLSAPAYWPHRLAGRAAGRRLCPSGEGARHLTCQWRRFGNGITAALEFQRAGEFA